MKNITNGLKKAAENHKRYSTLIIFLLISGTTSVLLGQDANWDLRNYHLYNAFSFLNDRLTIDALAAGIQTYFHPLLDLPYYLLYFYILDEWPKTLAFLAGIPYGLLLFSVFCICTDIFRLLQQPNWYLYSLISTSLGTTGVATLSQTGTTFNEVTIAAFITSGIAIITNSISWNQDTPSSKAILLAGILLGLAAGLKLTAVIYAPAVSIALLLYARLNKKNTIITFIFCSGWVLAFLPIWGFWGMRLYELTGNPMFPMLNNLFQSDWMSTATGGFDNKFKPSSWLQALLYPFYWILNGENTVMEIEFSDPRFAIGFLAFFSIIATLTVSKLKAKNKKNPTPLQSKKNPSTLNFLLLYILVSYILWMSLFSILRYAVAIEALLGLVIGVAITLACKKLPSHHLPSQTPLAFLILILLTATSMTAYPYWGRSNYSERTFQYTKADIPDSSLILLLSKPTAYIAPIMSQHIKNLTFIGLNYEYPAFSKFKLGSIIRKNIEKHQGPIYTLYNKEDINHAEVILERFNLSFYKSHCKTIETNIDLDDTLYYCPLVRTPKQASEIIEFNSDNDSANAALKNGWSTPEWWGVWSNAESSEIELPLDKFSDTDLELTFGAHAFLTERHQKLHLSLQVNGEHLLSFNYLYPQGKQSQIQNLVIPHHIIKNSKILNVRFNYQPITSPYTQGVGADNRQLGLGLSWIKLTSKK